MPVLSWIDVWPLTQRLCDRPTGQQQSDRPHHCWHSCGWERRSADAVRWDRVAWRVLGVRSDPSESLIECDSQTAVQLIPILHSVCRATTIESVPPLTPTQTVY